MKFCRERISQAAGTFGSINPLALGMLRVDLAVAGREIWANFWQALSGWLCSEEPTLVDPGKQKTAQLTQFSWFGLLAGPSLFVFGNRASAFRRAAIAFLSGLRCGTGR